MGIDHQISTNDNHSIIHASATQTHFAYLLIEFGHIFSITEQVNLVELLD